VPKRHRGELRQASSESTTGDWNQILKAFARASLSSGAVLSTLQSRGGHDSSPRFVPSPARSRSYREALVMASACRTGRRRTSMPLGSQTCHFSAICGARGSRVDAQVVVEQTTSSRELSRGGICLSFKRRRSHLRQKGLRTMAFAAGLGLVRDTCRALAWMGSQTFGSVVL
jgi:hypothetical protein